MTEHSDTAVHHRRDERADSPHPSAPAVDPKTSLGAVIAEWPARSGRFGRDVVGIGAINLDYRATVTAPDGGSRVLELVSRVEALFPEGSARWEWNTERLVDERIIDEALTQAARTGGVAVTTIGGSAYNTLVALAHLRLGSSLGFVGVAGRVPVPGVSAVEDLAALDIDHRWVRTDESRLCGVCFAVQYQGERTLLTHVGANLCMADFLAESFDDVVGYLASARVVHVTSFLDPRTAAVLGTVLAEVKRVNPGTRISVDPGHVWSAQPDGGVDEIIALADVVLVNDREFTELGRQRRGTCEDRVAECVLGRNKDMTVVVKRPDGVTVWRYEFGALTSWHVAQTPVPDDEIVDATGAGDVFAAGILAAIVSGRLDATAGPWLGMRLARHKLRHPGTEGHTGFEAIARAFHTPGM